MKYLVPCLIVVLIFLHQDYWQWNNGTLDFGFVPRALTYHASISLMAALTWAVAVRWCWPSGTHVSDTDVSSTNASEAGSNEGTSE